MRVSRSLSRRGRWDGGIGNPGDSRREMRADYRWVAGMERMRSSRSRGVSSLLMIRP